MTYARCARVQRLRLASRLLPRRPAGNDSDSDSNSEAFASANVMFDISDCEPDYTPPRLATSPPQPGVDSNWSSSNDTEESVLAGDEDLIDLRDEAEFEHAQEQRKTGVDVLLEEYRASLNALFGYEPSAWEHSARQGGGRRAERPGETVYESKLKNKLREGETAMEIAVTSHGRQHGSMCFNTPPCIDGHRKGIREPPRSRVAKGR